MGLSPSVVVDNFDLVPFGQHLPPIFDFIQTGSLLSFKEFVAV